MLFHINGWAGVGKLSVARVLAERLAARVLDNHTIYNVAFGLTKFRSPEFYETVRAVRDVAFARVRALPFAEHVIMTNALGADSQWATENWFAIRDLAKARQCPLIAVTLRCSVEEHLRRAMRPERTYLGKLTDRAELEVMLKRDLLEPEGADKALELDTTSMTPDAVAAKILE